MRRVLQYRYDDLNLLRWLAQELDWYTNQVIIGRPPAGPPPLVPDDLFGKIQRARRAKRKMKRRLHRVVTLLFVEMDLFDMELDAVLSQQSEQSATTETERDRDPRSPERQHPRYRTRSTPPHMS